MKGYRGYFVISYDEMVKKNGEQLLTKKFFNFCKRLKMNSPYNIITTTLEHSYNLSKMINNSKINNI